MVADLLTIHSPIQAGLTPARDSCPVESIRLPYSRLPGPILWRGYIMGDAYLAVTASAWGAILIALCCV